MPCAYAGLGFCAFRHGVFEDERLTYPWFYTNTQVIKTGREEVPEYHDLASEDVSLFRNLTEKGVIPAVMVKMRSPRGSRKEIDHVISVMHCFAFCFVLHFQTPTWRLRFSTSERNSLMASMRIPIMFP